ncbi:transporter substrate-binding domain-containing protein [Polaromonas sp. JS666]|uniref:transporter substrate-binding domain-containing protein n=1 Tax=Polaromonas sp. (strain JS666 / ATCC BAA-500) TaxID=296591 RepID=UPI0000464CA3|nr:transporter substrate-binding domain-containing protein [Polaromonas sp. JS666]ABE45870.1 amino acid ABC transporter substrate-binding protein, PAAT family [Polaromonas sp. JS666]
MQIKKILRVAAVGLTVLASVALTSTMASAQTVTDIIKRGKVKIGVLVGAPPMGAVDSSGNPVGYDADTAALIAKYLGVPLEMVALEPPARIPALESGKVDFLVSTLAPTPERAKTVMFTIPYNAFQVGIYAKKALKVKDWGDLKGKKVGVNRGSSVEAALVKQEGLVGLKVVRFDTDAAVIQAVFSGQIDACAEPDTMANQSLKARPDGDMALKFFFSKQPNSIAVRKDAFELQQWLNNTIYYIKVNGELDEIARKWVGSPLPELPTF